MDGGSWLLPKVPPAPTRETAVPGEQGHPKGRGDSRDRLLRGHPGEGSSGCREKPQISTQEGGSKRGHALRVRRETPRCGGLTARHLWRVLSLPPAPSQVPGEGTCCCPPRLKPFPPGLPCNSGVLRKEGLSNSFPPAASWLLTWHPWHTNPGADAVSVLSSPSPSFAPPLSLSPHSCCSAGCSDPSWAQGMDSACVVTCPRVPS